MKLSDNSLSRTGVFRLSRNALIISTIHLVFQNCWFCIAKPLVSPRESIGFALYTGRRTHVHQTTYVCTPNGVRT